MPARMILNVFKVIAFSMIFVFVLDLSFYLYKALNLNQRMESLGVSLQKVVTENNYLPEGEYNMFMSMFDNIGKTMNGGAISDSISDIDQNFIVFQQSNGDTHAVTLNWEDDPNDMSNVPTVMSKAYDKSTGSVVNKNLVHYNLNDPGDYGDVMYIEASVRILQPTWGFVDSSMGALSSASWNKIEDYATTTFTYNYLVPCLKYQSVTN